MHLDHLESVIALAICLIPLTATLAAGAYLADHLPERIVLMLEQRQQGLDP